jgi:flagellar hook assembly protein FlgD
MTARSAQYGEANLGFSAAAVTVVASPNPFVNETTIKYHVTASTDIAIYVYNMNGQLVETLVNKKQAAGDYTAVWNASSMAEGVYVANVVADGKVIHSSKLVKSE